MLTGTKLTNLPNKSMKQRQGASAAHKIPRILQNSKVRYRLHKIPFIYSCSAPHMSTLSPPVTFLTHPLQYYSPNYTCVFFLQVFNQNTVCNSLPTHACFKSHPSHSTSFYRPKHIFKEQKVMRLLNIQISANIISSSLIAPNIFLMPYCQISSVCVFPAT